MNNNPLAFWMKALALLHIAVGLIIYRGPLQEWWQAGFLNTVEPHWPRMSAYWFLMFGALMFAVGQLSERAPLPKPFIYSWLLICMVGILGMFQTGLWLGLLWGFMALAQHRRAA